MRYRRSIALALAALGAVLLVPFAVILLNGVLKGPSLIVVAASIGWVLAAVPVAGILGLALISVGIWLALKAAGPALKARRKTDMQTRPFARAV
jgi:hypothetical protein